VAAHAHAHIHSHGHAKESALSVTFKSCVYVFFYLTFFIYIKSFIGRLVFISLFL